MVPTPVRISLLRALRAWWKDRRERHGLASALRMSVADVLEFLRDSTPERRRQRYGDVEYDWEYRLLGVLNSPYQPTEPVLFEEMLASIKIDFRNFTFIDLGSGKGRVLLLASDYPFRQIVGVELLPALN